MISTLLAQYPALVYSGFCTAVVLLFALVMMLLRGRRRRTMVALLITSLVAAAVLTLAPTSANQEEVRCTVQFSVPFRGVETLANIGLLLPAAMLGAALTRRPLVIIAAGVGASAFVEALQAFIPAIGRACDTNDLWMNSIGVVLGACMGCLVRALLPEQRAPQDEPASGEAK